MYRSTILLLLLAAAPPVAAHRAITRPVTVPPLPTGRAAWVAASQDSIPLSPEAGRLRQLHILPDGRGLAVGSGARIWSTLDGGRSWSADSAAPAQFLASAALLGGEVRLVADVVGRVYRSVDGGEWKRVREHSGEAGRMRIADDGSVLLVGYGVISHSTDEGLTWTDTKLARQRWTDAVLAGHVGYIVGGAGLVLRTGNGGGTWETRHPGSVETFNGLAVLDELTVVVVGSGGSIHRTSDGGASWQTVRSGTAVHLRAVAFANAREGVAVGFFGTVLRTSDGGRTWTAENSGTRAHLTDVVITDDGEAHASGWFDTLIRSESRPGRIEP